MACLLCRLRRYVRDHNLGQDDEALAQALGFASGAQMKKRLRGECGEPMSGEIKRRIRALVGDESG